MHCIVHTHIVKKVLSGNTFTCNFQGAYKICCSGVHSVSMCLHEGQDSDTVCSKCPRTENLETFDQCATTGKLPCVWWPSYMPHAWGQTRFKTKASYLWKNYCRSHTFRKDIILVKILPQKSWRRDAEAVQLAAIPSYYTFGSPGSFPAEPDGHSWPIRLAVAACTALGVKNVFRTTCLCRVQGSGPAASHAALYTGMASKTNISAADIYLAWLAQLDAAWGYEQILKIR